MLVCYISHVLNMLLLLLLLLEILGEALRIRIIIIIIQNQPETACHLFVQHLLETSFNP